MSWKKNFLKSFPYPLLGLTSFEEFREKRINDVIASSIQSGDDDVSDVKSLDVDEEVVNVVLTSLLLRGEIFLV